MTESYAGPAVTAVIPAYNKEEFIGRALESALGQTFPNLEIIVVDDGSTDGTLAVSERIAAKHQHVRVISVTNGGVAAARNLGMLLATTPYVAFLDADDLWHPEKITRQVAAMAAHGHDGEWVGCYALSRFIDRADQVLGNGPLCEARGSFFEEHLYRNHVGNGSCLLVRRDAALAVGGFDPEHAKRGLGGVEDYDFQLRLLRRYKLEVVREFLVGYRVYRGQMSDDLERMAKARTMVVDAVLADCDLPRRKRIRAVTYGRIAAAYLKLQAGTKWAGLADVAGALARAPVMTLELLWCLAAGRRVRRSQAPSDLPDVASGTFAELLPASGTITGDDVRDGRHATLNAMRQRSAFQDQTGEGPIGRTAGG